MESPSTYSLFHRVRFQDFHSLEVPHAPSTDRLPLLDDLKMRSRFGFVIVVGSAPFELKSSHIERLDF